jgi:hypothetical protein
MKKRKETTAKNINSTEEEGKLSSICWKLKSKIKYNEKGLHRKHCDTTKVHITAQLYG